MSHERVGERALAGAVRAHDRVHFAAVHRQVDAVEDLLALDGDLEAADYEQFFCHLTSRLDVYSDPRDDGLSSFSVSGAAFRTTYSQTGFPSMMRLTCSTGAPTSEATTL